MFNLVFSSRRIDVPHGGGWLLIKASGQILSLADTPGKFFDPQQLASKGSPKARLSSPMGLQIDLGRDVTFPFDLLSSSAQL